MNRQEGYRLLRKYNKDPFHIRHALTVEGVMRFMADALDYGDEAAYWAMVGLLHDIDFEQYPDLHCVKALEIYALEGIDDDMARACACHGYGLTGVTLVPTHEMEKVLYAVDELTGLIYATALMRPSKSTLDMEPKSVMKKLKTLAFAAGCSREVIQNGADILGWPLDKLVEQTLLAMRACEASVQVEMANLEGE